MKIDLLDHGFVRLVEAWGTGDNGVRDGCAPDFEVGIIEAARQSTQGGFKGWDKDAALLKYLYEHKHGTPFEFSGMVLEVRAPIFIFREWHRHRTQSYNEMSARYGPLPDLNYMPTIERLMMGADERNRQAGKVKGAALMTEAAAVLYRNELQAQYNDFEEHYQRALAAGVPKELARIGMPVGRYSQMRAATCLRNWLMFLTLRQEPAAQLEIRQYADAVASIVEDKFPQTYKLYASR